MAYSPFRWTDPIQKHFDARVAALVEVPHAQDHEAPNSWLMRVAALQGCHALELAAYLGFTFRADFDLAYYFVFRKVRSEAPQVQGLERGRVYAGAMPRFQSAGRWMKTPTGHRARYRFCPLCLRHDQVPCIHQYARMEELVFCPWHRCLLEAQCPNCNAYVELMQDMATAGPRQIGVGDMSFCLRCAGPLDAMDPLAMDFEFVQRLPHWLKDWGLHGPEAVQGKGMTISQLSREHQRLSGPPVPKNPLIELQRRSITAFLATATAASERGGGEVLEASGRPREGGRSDGRPA